MATVHWTSSTVTAAGVELHLHRGSQGSPILLLHRDIGTLDSLPFYDALARTHDVSIPHHPGYGQSSRPDWVANVRDNAVIYRALMGNLDLRQATLLGLGFGSPA